MESVVFVPGSLVKVCVQLQSIRLSFGSWFVIVLACSSLCRQSIGVGMAYSYDLLLQQLGARIKELRKARGWTLRDMVVQHGFHLSHWQGFESGTRGISIPSLLRISEVLDVSPSQLLEGLGKTEGKKIRQHPNEL